MKRMRKNAKLAGIMLAVNLTSGITGIIYLIALWVKGAGKSGELVIGRGEPIAVFLLLAAIMIVSLVVMIFTLPKGK